MRDYRLSLVRKYKTYSKEFKEEAVSLVTDQGYSVAEAAEAVGQVVYPCFYHTCSSSK